MGEGYRVFSAGVVLINGEPAVDLGMMISYFGVFGGPDEKRADSDGRRAFHNRDNNPGTNWVYGTEMGDYFPADG